MKIRNISSLSLAGVLCTAALSAHAHAGPSEIPPEASAEASPAPAARAAPRFALGVNTPIGWRRRSFAASLSGGLSRHHAVRASFARYDADDTLLVIAALATGGERESWRSGRLLDASVGWVYYPRRLWDGFMLEVDALRRQRAIRDAGEDEITKIRSVTYAGRATIGWSWPVTRHAFISAAAGVSVGRETGEELIVPEIKMPTRTALDRVDVAPELYLRFGLTFGR